MFLSNAWAAVDTVGEWMTPGVGTAELDGDPAWLDGKFALMRLQIWTAIGMVNVALSLTTAQALDRLRGYAYSHSSTIDALATA